MKGKNKWQLAVALLAALLSGVVVTQPQLVDPRLASVLLPVAQILDVASK